MVSRNYLLCAVTGLSVLFASCKKDVISEQASLASSTLSSDANAADGIVETSAPSWTSVVTNVNSNVAGFWQGVPALYSQTTKKYPLILFIHGIGELGTSITRMNCCGLPSHLYRKTFPANFRVNGVNSSFLVIAPQFKWRPSAADMQSVIDYAKRRWRVDETRVYVTGLSMGGGSTWDYSAVYGQNAAAVVPVCGGTAATSALSQKIASKNLPIWALYSYADKVVPASWGTNFLKWIDGFNPSYAAKTKLTIWSDVDHNHTWGRAFDPKTRVDGYNIYEWMLLYRRSGGQSTGPAPAPTPTPTPTPTKPTPTPSNNRAPIAKAGADQTVPASWKSFPNLNANQSTDADGYIAKFYWRQVSGPNTVTLATPNTGNTKVTNFTTGTYLFRVAVTDNDGAISYDDVSITVTGSSTGGSSTPPPPVSNPGSSNRAPVARAGADVSVPRSWNWFPPLNANFSTDSDGWLKRFYWRQVSGPSTARIANPNTGNTKISGLVVGRYLFRVAVTDDDNAVSYDDIYITVTNN